MPFNEVKNSPTGFTFMGIKKTMPLKFIFCFVWISSLAQSDFQKIEALSKKFSADYIKGDFEAMAQAYTTHAIIFAPGKDIIRGRTSIKIFWEALPKVQILYHRTESDTLFFVGNEVHDYGYYYTQSQKPSGEINPSFSAKYYIIWEQENGIWKMKMDMWNGRNQDWNK